MPKCEVHDEAVSRQLPHVVSQAQSFRARHPAQGQGRARVNRLEARRRRGHRVSMIREIRRPRKGRRVGAAPARGRLSDIIE